jgi:two-component system cell cycle response regulator
MGARILVVEDNPANLELMTYLLKSFGHIPLVARDGEQALDIIRREALDLIVCDLQLPKIDGYEVARQMALEPILCRVPLLAVTAFVMVGDRDKVLAAGFDGYISKPIVPRTFVQQVEGFLPPELHSAPKPPAPASGNVHSLPKGNRATVLVVDDLPVNIRLARNI